MKHSSDFKVFEALLPPASGQKILMAEAYPETPVIMYQTTWRHIPEHRSLGKKKMFECLLFLVQQTKAQYHLFQVTAPCSGLLSPKYLRKSSM